MSSLSLTFGTILAGGIVRPCAKRAPTRMTRLTIMLVAAFTASPAMAAEETDKNCRNLYRLTDTTWAVEPGFLVDGTDELPAHCRVRGVVNRAIRFEVTLPLVDEWNGRLMFSAVGGGAGTLGDTSSLLGRGFAMATTDTGHELEDPDFLRQPEALLDYAYRGVHLATRVAKAVVTRYYGRDIDYAYLQGCSNGGRAALLEAIRFPDDYDGIIAGAPLLRFQESLPWAVGAGRLQRRHPLTQGSLRLLDDASRNACDLLDGVEDGVINDPRACTDDYFNVDGLACAPGQREGCLTPGQLETARYMYNDVVDAKGNVISPGVLPGGEAAGDWAFWMLPNALVGNEADSIIGSMEQTLIDLMRGTSTFDVEAFDPVDDRHTLTDAMAPFDVGTADLSEFRAHGGKLLMYQGWNDYLLRPGRALDYLAEVERESGGVAETSEFFRLFMVPGMLHCAGGPGPWQADYVDPLVAWRERGEAPERIVGTHPGPSDLDHLSEASDRPGDPQSFTRPLCAYPELAEYTGQGDMLDERSFACVAK